MRFAPGTAEMNPTGARELVEAGSRRWRARDRVMRGVGTRTAGSTIMDRLNMVMSRHASAARAAWIVLVLVLAACNNGGDGGGPGY